MSSDICFGDCLSVLPLFPERCVNLCVTSPPYADKRLDSYDGISEVDYPGWIMSVISECMRVLTDDGSMVLNIKEHVRDGVRSPYVYKMALMISESPYHLVDEFVWHKTNPFPTGSKKRLKDGWERCFHITKKLDYKFNPKAVSAPSTSKYANDSARRKNKGAHSVNNGSGMNMSKRVVVDKVRPSNVISGSSSNLNIGHPAAFPEYLPEFFIKLLTDPGDRVLDPFVGSGTTALAALNLGRSVIGIDSNIDYVDLARERISKIGTLV